MSKKQIGELLKLGIRKQIKDGMSMNVIVDIWVLKTSTFKMITFIFYDIVLIVANLLDVNRH